MAELLLGSPLFPGESGVDQLVEIIKVRCGAVSAEEGGGGAVGRWSPLAASLEAEAPKQCAVRLICASLCPPPPPSRSSSLGRFWAPPTARRSTP